MISIWDQFYSMFNFQARFPEFSATCDSRYYNGIHQNSMFLNATEPRRPHQPRSFQTSVTGGCWNQKWKRICRFVRFWTTARSGSANPLTSWLAPSHERLRNHTPNFACTSPILLVARAIPQHVPGHRWSPTSPFQRSLRKGLPLWPSQQGLRCHTNRSMKCTRKCSRPAASG